MNAASASLKPSYYVPIFDPHVYDEPRHRGLRDWWDEKGGDRAMPQRSEVDPVELREHLGSLVLIECLPDLDDFCYRLIGAEVVNANGRDSTGSTMRELYRDSDSEYQDFLLDVYRTLASRQITARLRHPAPHRQRLLSLRHIPVAARPPRWRNRLAAEQGALHLAAAPKRSRT